MGQAGLQAWRSEALEHLPPHLGGSSRSRRSNSSLVGPILLRQRHHAGDVWAGVDLEKEDICNTFDAFVWEPAMSKLNSFAAATEAACVVLSVVSGVLVAAVCVVCAVRRGVCAPPGPRTRTTDGRSAVWRTRRDSRGCRSTTCGVQKFFSVGSFLKQIELVITPKVFFPCRADTAIKEFLRSRQEPCNHDKTSSALKFSER